MARRAIWRRAWWIGFLAAPCIEASATGDRVEWLAWLGLVLWGISLLYVVLYSGLQE